MPVAAEYRCEGQVQVHSDRARQAKAHTCAVNAESWGEGRALSGGSWLITLYLVSLRVQDRVVWWCGVFVFAYLMSRPRCSNPLSTLFLFGDHCTVSQTWTWDGVGPCRSRSQGRADAHTWGWWAWGSGTERCGMCARTNIGEGELGRRWGRGMRSCENQQPKSGPPRLHGWGSGVNGWSILPKTKPFSGHRGCWFK